MPQKCLGHRNGGLCVPIDLKPAAAASQIRGSVGQGGRAAGGTATRRVALDTTKPVYLTACKDMSRPVMDRVEASLEIAERWIKQAIHRLNGAMNFVVSGDKSSKASYELVHRCFKVKSLDKSAATSALFRLIRIFKSMREVIKLSQTGDKTYFQVGTTDCTNNNAWTPVGTFAERDPDKYAVYYCIDNIADFDCEDLVDVTLHELSHFAGPSGGDGVGHQGGKGGLAALTLPHDDAVHNASCFAWLCWLARLPSSEWLTNTGQKRL